MILYVKNVNNLHKGHLFTYTYMIKDFVCLLQDLDYPGQGICRIASRFWEYGIRKMQNGIDN